MSVKNGWNWVFGNYQWMSFSATTGDVTYVHSADTSSSEMVMAQEEGCDSTSDDNGNLLFYTNGITVWNSSGNTIETSLGGSNNSMQSSTIIKSPYTGSSYYIFTTGDWSNPAETIEYTIIDFGLDPTGTTVSLNTPLVGGNNYDENLTSTRHSNGTDFWIISRRRSSTYFDAWSSVTSGMSSNIVSSDIGHEFNGSNRYGQIKMSPSGDRIGFSIGGSVGTGFNPKIAVYDFDTSTGVISNPTVLVGSGTSYTFTFTGSVTQDLSTGYVISCDFSPNGDYLYTTMGGAAQRNLIQFNLTNLGTYPSSSGNTVIPDTHARLILDPSDTRFSGVTGTWNGGISYGIHRGPNQRVYFLRSKNLSFTTQPIGVYEIKYPNNLVSSPTSIGVSEIFFDVSNNGPYLAMPNISGVALPPTPPCSADTYCINSTDTYFDDTYSETGTTFDGYQVWVGDTNGLFLYFSTGDTQWCLSESLGGPCLLSGKSPCVSECPDLCEEFFFEGTCPTTTTTTIACMAFDFDAIFDCLAESTPTPTPTPSITPTMTVTPSSTNYCSMVSVDSTIDTYTPTPTPTPTMTPTSSGIIIRPCNVLGDVSFTTLDGHIGCPTSKQFQDCVTGMMYYTTELVPTPSGDPLTEFMIFKSYVDGVLKCVSFVGINNDIIGVNTIELVEGPTGYSNLGECVLCDVIPSSTPTPTPTMTPTPSGIPCFCYELIALQSTTFNYIDCNGLVSTATSVKAIPTYVCSLTLPTTTSLFPYSITKLGICVDGVCPPLTCNCYTVSNGGLEVTVARQQDNSINNVSTESYVNMVYTDCNNVQQVIVINNYTTTPYFCSLTTPFVYSSTNIVTITLVGDCTSCFP